ncbi:MAG: cation:proton antiporter [Pseudomonadota bacterium]
MTLAEFLPWLQIPLLVAGCLFFGIGTLGLFRLTETRDRLHALTKVDNLGLGLIALALLPSVPTVGDGAKILLVWLVVLMASATSAHLIARAAGRDVTREDP